MTSGALRLTLAGAGLLLLAALGFPAALAAPALGVDAPIVAVAAVLAFASAPLVLHAWAASRRGRNPRWARSAVAAAVFAGVLEIFASRRFAAAVEASDAGLDPSRDWLLLDAAVLALVVVPWAAFVREALDRRSGGTETPVVP